MSQFYKNLALWLVICLMMVLLFNMMTAKGPEQRMINYSTFLTELESGNVREVTIQGRKIVGRYQDDGQFETYSPTDDSLVGELREKGVQIVAKPEEDRGLWFTLLVSWGPILLLIAVWVFFMRQMQSGGGKAMSFGKSKAKLLSDTQAVVTFSDVAGIDEAKEELEEIVSFLKDPKKFSRLGGRIPKGVLLVGSPGTGKTLLARAIAGEAGVPFFSISGSDFVEMFVGVGASRVRDLFLQGKKNAPCIIFIDEIDAVGRQRGAGLGGSHDEREQTLNQILVEMDGFGTDIHIIILAATNRPDILDPALMRPGRFDRRVVIDRPDIRGREEIFEVHLRGKPLSESVDTNKLAKATPGFVGADIENTVNESALLAARRNRDVIGMPELQEAIERVQLGPERKSRIISDEEKEITAYHEAGHALVSHYLPHAQSIRKITIIPRGMAGGVTWFMEDDLIFYSRSKFKALIATALGGRVAEDLVFGEITTGASNDLQQVTKMARAMVTQYGMSDEMGPRVYGDKQELVFLGREISEQRDYSESIAEQIDREVRRIIDTEYARARRILVENRQKLDRLSENLLEFETLEAEEFVALIEGREKPTRSKESASNSDLPRSEAGDKTEWEAPSNLDLPPAPSPA